MGVDRDYINLDDKAPFVFPKALEYERYEVWELLLAYFGQNDIVNTSKQLRAPKGDDILYTK